MQDEGLAKLSCLEVAKNAGQKKSTDLIFL